MQQNERDRVVIALLDSGGSLFYDDTTGDIRGIYLVSCERLPQLDRIETGPYFTAGLDRSDNTYLYATSWSSDTGEALARICATWYDDQERSDHSGQDQHRGERITISEAITQECRKSLDHLRRAATLSGRSNREELAEIIGQLETIAADNKK